MSSARYERQHVPALARRKVAVILPKLYHGGVLRATKNIVRMICRGSRLSGDSVTVVLAVPEGAYDVSEEFKDLSSDEVQVREVRPRLLGRDAIETLWRLAGRDKFPNINVGVHYRDGIADLLDCDLWLVITNRTVDEDGVVRPVVPLRPVVMVPFDFIEHYVPAISPDANVREAHAAATRQADLVLVTQPQTARDAISFAGCQSNRVVQVPIEFDLTSECVAAGRKAKATRMRNKLGLLCWIWPTNTSMHKNHGRIFKGLRQAADRGVDTVGRMTGPFVEHYLSTAEFGSSLGPDFMENWQLFRTLRVRDSLEVLGYLDEHAYFEELRRSDFLLNSAVYDNGAYALVEGAYLGVPSLCSDYPQMRYLADLTGIPAVWFDPYDSESFADALATMVAVQEDVKAGLPSPESFTRFGWEVVAQSWWSTVQAGLKRVSS